MESTPGLSSAEAKKLLAKFGLNVLTERKPGVFSVILRWFISPIALMLLAAAGLSLTLGKIFDFYFILALLLANSFIGTWQKRKADNALARVQEQLVINVDVFRDGVWQKLESKYLVPGDTIRLYAGDVVPADLKILTATQAAINEAPVTGESLPKEKRVGDAALIGTFVVAGIMTAEVTATGNRTSFGSVIAQATGTVKRSLLERDILVISKFLSGLSFVAVLVLSAIFIFLKTPLLEIIRLDLGLVIAGIPISLPTVMTIIIALGVLELAKRNVVVRRLASLENLANVDLLLSDKTGTLTENKIMIERIIAYGSYTSRDVMRFAAATSESDHSAIDQAIAEKAAMLGITRPSVKSFMPADAVRKHNTAVFTADGEDILVSIGAAQVISKLVSFSEGQEEKLWSDINAAAAEGYRALVVAGARNQHTEENLELVGMLLLSDTLLPDAKETIGFLRRDGIRIKMLTGDNRAIGRRIAQALGFTGTVTAREDLPKFWAEMAPSWLDDKDVFAEILPEDKLNIVRLAEQNHIVAVTGDGINDLPAMKAADVSIAVSNATDAVKSSADIFLLTSGISVIRQAFEESRKIFTRLYTYSIYRLSESFRLIITITILGIFYRQYPLTPVLLILIALFNDIPIISLAFDRVKQADKPQKIHVHERFLLSSLFGTVGVLNSLLLFLIFTYVAPVPWKTLITMFFLKLLVSGHMLIYVAHTRERWYRFLPSSPVIWATSLTQIGATIIAFLGLFTAPISLSLIGFVWVWSFLWMQITEGSKVFYQKYFNHPERAPQLS